MVNFLLLSGYIPPSGGFFVVLFVALLLVAMLGIWLLVLGLAELRQDRKSMRGYWLIAGSLIVPTLGYTLLASSF